MRRVSEILGDILGINTETDDLTSPTKVNTKKPYPLLKHSKQDNSGISSLKANEKTFNADVDKASTLNQQSTSYSALRPQHLLKLKPK